MNINNCDANSSLSIVINIYESDELFSLLSLAVFGKITILGLGVWAREIQDKVVLSPASLTLRLTTLL